MELQRMHMHLTNALKTIPKREAVKVSVIVGGQELELDVEDIRVSYVEPDIKDFPYIVIVTPQRK